MRRCRIVVQVLGAAGLAVAGLTPLLAVPAYADCEIVSATHGGNWQGEALSGAQALAARSARDLKAKKGWRGITMKGPPGEAGSVLEDGAAAGLDQPHRRLVRDGAHLHHLLDRRHRTLRLHLRRPGVRELIHANLGASPLKGLGGRGQVDAC
jgi:hypothetical protein